MQGTPTAPWLDAEGRFFNPSPQVTVLPTGPDGHRVVVVEQALANPQGLRAWAANQALAPPVGYPYPGQVCAVPDEMTARLADFFSLHIRAHLAVRRVLGTSVRLSVVDTPPDQLQPVQWLCHRDRLPAPGGNLLFAASVLYLFDDPSLGGTSFYAPRQPAPATDQLVADSQALPAAAFTVRYGLQPGYMAGSNRFFERTAQIPAAWNRLIVYDGSRFHSADVNTARLDSHPLQGRLTLNGFFTCRLAAG